MSSYTRSFGFVCVGGVVAVSNGGACLTAAVSFAHSKRSSAGRGQQNDFVEYSYGAGHLIRNGKDSPGLISYLRMGPFHNNFSIMTPEFLI